MSSAKKAATKLFQTMRSWFTINCMSSNDDDNNDNQDGLEPSNERQISRGRRYTPTDAVRTFPNPVTRTFSKIMNIANE